MECVDLSQMKKKTLPIGRVALRMECVDLSNRKLSDYDLMMRRTPHGVRGFKLPFYCAIPGHRSVALRMECVDLSSTTGIMAHLA